MKKLTLFFLSLLACGLAFQACDNTKTYAEMLRRKRCHQSIYKGQ